jgi:hypothetical protein
MKIPAILAAAAVAAAAFVPAAALADLQVNANGFYRVVESSTQGDSCEVEHAPGGMSVSCPDGSRGTLVLYRSVDEAAVCEVDFWYAGNGSGMQRWRAQISHANPANGTCTLHWNDPTTLNLTVQPANSPA